MEIPTFTEIARIAPITSIILLVGAVGYFARTEHIKTLKEFIDHLKDKK